MSKSFKNGEFYNIKCVVHDVITKGICTLKTPEGVILDNVNQQYLETVIPKTGRDVMVLKHSDPSLVGQLAKLLEYNSKNEKCVVQIESTFEMEVLEINLDFEL